MDVDTITNLVRNLSHQDFKKIVHLILTRIFDLKVANVDGPSDGGTDWKVFEGQGGTLSFAVQDTTQQTGWEEKALNDAEKAVHEIKAKRYYFLTTNNPSFTKQKKLENDIADKFGIPATCLGASAIASFIVDYKLTTDFLDAINAPLAAGLAKRPDAQEVSLHAYLLMGKETQDLRNSVYDDTILLVLYKEGDLARRDLVEKVINNLQCDEYRATRIDKRIDSLFTRGDIVISTDPQKVKLGNTTKEKLINAERIYLREFQLLASAQYDIMKKYVTNWKETDAEQLSVLLARTFIQKELESIQNAKVTLVNTGLIKNTFDAFVQMNDYLRAKGVPNKKVQEIALELVNQAKDLPIVKKLALAAVFVTLEGSEPLSASKALGASRWSDVNVMLDASVAIPYLCSRLYKPTRGRYAYENYEAIKNLQNLSANIFMPYCYISECASHLIKARHYDHLDKFNDALEYSRNGYVSHYYHLKSAGVKVPESIYDYLGTFAEGVKRTSSDTSAWIRKVMTELQEKFMKYGVKFYFLNKHDDIFQKELETEYIYYLDKWARHKSSKLIDHDVWVVAQIKREVSQQNKCWMVLTWDRAMLSVGQNVNSCGWIISPEIACDFVATSNPLGEMELCALSHALAKAHDEPLMLTARIIDHITEMADEKLQDWEFQIKIRNFSEQLYKRIDLKSVMYDDLIEKETDRFLQEVGIDISRKKPDSNAEFFS